MEYKMDYPVDILFSTDYKPKFNCPICNKDTPIDVTNDECLHEFKFVYCCGIKFHMFKFICPQCNKEQVNTAAIDYDYLGNYIYFECCNSRFCADIINNDHTFNFYRVY